jgi:NAD-dependent SIR2 family protein deacetylase
MPLRTLDRVDTVAVGGTDPAGAAAPPAPAASSALERAADLLADGGVVALTGAGVSTDSGIPDYRGPVAPVRRPMTYAEFLADPTNRRRYWARSHVGWRRIADARANAGHRALGRLEAVGLVDAVITQNVDRLHLAGGSRRVVELHGRIDQVVCMSCRAHVSRSEVAVRLEALNPDWGVEHRPAPDGDAEVGDPTGFRVADCRRCGGILKPDLVFFGESVPRARVERCQTLIDHARALLVAGTSLTVLSGRRFVVRADRREIPIVLVNLGPTRSDDLATVRIEAGCSPTLDALTTLLDARPVGRPAGPSRQGLDVPTQGGPLVGTE